MGAVAKANRRNHLKTPHIVRQSQLVSVLIPSYNAETTITAALESLNAQTYRPLEIIIVDDASADNTLRTVEQYRQQHPELPLRIITKTENRGPAHSRNIGIHEARGFYITLLDSDDYFAPDKIEKQTALLEMHPEYIGCGTFLQCFGQQQNIVEVEIDPDRLKDILLIGMPFLHASFLFRRDFILDNQLFYNEDYRTAEDYDWALRLFDAGARITTLPEPLYYYRISGCQESFSKTVDNNVVRNERQWEVAKLLHYRVWHRFLPETHPLHLLEYVEVFLRHISLRHPSEIPAYEVWFAKIRSYNHQQRFFTPSFLEENFAFGIQHYLLGQSVFSLQLLWSYFRLSHYIRFPSAGAKVKFILKCLIGYRYP